MRMSDEGLALLKKFEGLELEPYKCPAGVWTIGYGHTAAAGEPYPSTLTKITEAEAEALLRRGLRQYEDAVAKAIKRPIAQNQFDAFVSLCYNIGKKGFRKSTAVRRFNAGNIQGAAEAITWFNKANGKVLRGLTRRREAERALFLRDQVEAAPDEAPIPLPRAGIEGGEQKPLAASKTAGAGTVAVVTGGLGLWSQFKEAAPELVQDLGPFAMALVIGACVFIVWNRRQEALAGEH